VRKKQQNIKGNKMRHFNILKIIFCLIIIQASCVSATTSIINKTHQINDEIANIASELFYDSIYYSIEYYLSCNKWPTLKEDLINYGIKNNFTINFDQFKYFAIEQCSDKRINIHFIINQLGSNNQFKHNIKGIIGIYIEDKNKINIKNNKDKQIICSFTIGQYPYTDHSKSITDGYNVHIYIETDEQKTINKSNLIIYNYLMKKSK